MNGQLCAKATLLSRQELQVQNGHKVSLTVGADHVILCACEQYNMQSIGIAKSGTAAP